MVRVTELVIKMSMMIMMMLTILIREGADIGSGDTNDDGGDEDKSI